MWWYTHLIDLTGAQQLLVWKQQTGSKSALGLTENMCTEGNGAHFSECQRIFTLHSGTSTTLEKMHSHLIWCLTRSILSLVQCTHGHQVWTQPKKLQSRFRFHDACFLHIGSPLVPCSSLPSCPSLVHIVHTYLSFHVCPF